MAVFVDAYRAPYGPFRRMRMSHMVADTLEELHAMADAVGLRREWYQGEASFPHYDVCESKRKAAMARGAIEVDRNGLVAAMRRIRESGAYQRVDGVWEAAK